MREDIQRLTLLIHLLQDIFSQSANVHDHTAKIGELTREFIAIEAKYRIADDFPCDLTIQQITNDILQACPETSKTNVATILASIAAAPAIEGETGLNIQYLLTRAWAFRNLYSNGASLIIDNLEHNIIGGGGCMAGIAGRLAQPYTALLLSALRKKAEEREAEELAAAVKANTYDDNQADEELELACALSKSYITTTHQYDYTKKLAAAADDEDDEDLALALALSISNSEDKTDQDTNAATAASAAVTTTHQYDYTKKLAATADDEDDEDLALALALSISNSEDKTDQDTNAATAASAATLRHNWRAC